MSNVWGQQSSEAQRCAVHLPGDQACDETCRERLNQAPLAWDQLVTATIGPDSEADMATAGVDADADSEAEAEQLARLGDLAE